MAVTLEQLEQRLAIVEQEVMRLRQQVPSPVATTKTWAELAAQSCREKPRLKAIIAKVFEQMGITGTPVPPQQLREMMAACGIKAEDRLFSRGIQEMREE